MKSWLRNLLLTSTTLALCLLTGCVSPTTSTPPTSRTELIAAAVEDLLAIGLVPVLSKNPAYLPAAQAVAATLGTFSGSTLTPDDVDAFLARTSLVEEDRRAVAGIVNAAWSVFTRRYAEQVGASIRPDVRLFLAAVSRGITSAVAAVPKTVGVIDGKQWGVDGTLTFTSR